MFVVNRGNKMSEFNFLVDWVVDQAGGFDDLDRGWLEVEAHDGLGFIWFGEYEAFLEKWKDDDEVDSTFEDMIASRLSCIERKGGWEYTFFENLTIEHALEISRNITLSNNPWVDDILYKGKSLCSKTGWPVELSDRYENVARILNDIQGVIKGTCDIAYTRICRHILEDTEELEVSNG